MKNIIKLAFKFLILLILVAVIVFGLIGLKNIIFT